MDRKAYLLSSLKKQVLELKTQLDFIEKAKPEERAQPRQVTESSRFSSISVDSSYRDRGVRKFPAAADNCHNIAAVIKERSVVEKQPSLSPFRKAEYERTRVNFSALTMDSSRQMKTLSPNPLTGEGYPQKRGGIKPVFPKYDNLNKNRKETQRRHFSVHFY
jgi:hypothetical protein